MHRWSWTVIECCWGAWAITWITLAFSAKRTVERPGGAWSWGAVVGAVAVYAAIRAATGRSWVHEQVVVVVVPRAVQVLAVALVACGLGFCTWARVTIGRNWSGSVALKEDHELIETGPYALARHPIYTGMLAMVLGSAIDYPAAVSYTGLGLVIVVFFFKSRREERLMDEHFPDQCPAYRARVKAIIPFIV